MVTEWLHTSQLDGLVGDAADQLLNMSTVPPVYPLPLLRTTSTPHAHMPY